jgi:hypothetical protein
MYNFNEDNDAQELLRSLVTRLMQFALLSNLDIDEVFEWAGVNLNTLNEDFVHQTAYWEVIRMKRAERERLQQFGIQLFENKLPDWIPA